MALVEIVSPNLYAGANLRKLEVGAVVEVDDQTAERWKSTGKAKETDKKKGEKLTFEVATPSSNDKSHDLKDIQEHLDLALQNGHELQTKLEDKERSHAEEIEQLKQQHAAEVDELTKRGEAAEAAQAGNGKKDK